MRARTLFACVATLLGTVASAQVAAQPDAASWSDPEFAKIAELMTGSWRTTEAVSQFGDAAQQVEVVMSIAPVSLSELPDALYIETARADSVERPYRGAFLQLYRRQGAIRMRTLEIRAPRSNLHSLVLGLWAAPQFMPDIPMSTFIGTLDLELVAQGDGYVGETPYPYPTATGGAVEMTSRMTIAPGRITTEDRGFSADGDVLWGADEGGTYEFAPTEPPFTTHTTESGLTMIVLREDESGPDSASGDQIAFQYSGWLTNGTMFDTSRTQDGRPMQYQLPGRLIDGWAQGTEGMSQGDWRKFVVPADLGYGSSSAAGGRIPPDSTLIFEAECVFVSKAEGGN